MNIRILARVVVYEEDKILLVKNKGESFWYAPGGGWEYEQETILQGAKREVKEETGLDVDIEKLLYLQEFRPESDMIFFETFWLAKPLPNQVLDKTHIDLDPNGQVEMAKWYSKEELQDLKVFPKRLKNTFWDIYKKESENPFITEA